MTRSSLSGYQGSPLLSTLRLIDLTAIGVVAIDLTAIGVIAYRRRVVGVTAIGVASIGVSTLSPL